MSTYLNPNAIQDNSIAIDKLGFEIDNASVAEYVDIVLDTNDNISTDAIAHNSQVYPKLNHILEQGKYCIIGVKHNFETNTTVCPSHSVFKDETGIAVVFDSIIIKNQNSFTLNRRQFYLNEDGTVQIL